MPPKHAFCIAPISWVPSLASSLLAIFLRRCLGYLLHALLHQAFSQFSGFICGSIISIFFSCHLPYSALRSFLHKLLFPRASMVRRCSLVAETSSSPELILPSVVATHVEPSIAQSVAAAYYPGADKCESTALPLFLWRGRGILSRRG